MRSVKTARSERTHVSRGILFTCIVIFSSFLQAQEIIKSFDSHITVNKDSSLLVREKIAIEFPNNLRRHGLIRDFPIRYSDRLGNTYNIGFQIQKVQKNGVDEPYFLKSASNGVRIYIGDKVRILKGGIYTYEITYHVTRMLGFFKDYDELYWNVTGNGWPFTIANASATVVLPEFISPDNIKISGYTGLQGAKEQNYRIVRKDSHLIKLETTAPLAPKQGFTIAIGWPKGVIPQPEMMQRLKDFMYDNIALIIVLFGFMVLALFSLWHYVTTKGTHRSVIIPLFYPPKDFSPGAVRYFIKFGYDAKVLAADIINMAVHGLITIHSDKKFIGRQYTIKKVKDAPAESDLYYYDELLDLLFGEKDTLELSKQNRTTINSAINFIDDSVLLKKIKSRYFNFHTEYVVWAIGIAALTILPSFYFLPWYGASYLYLVIVITMIILIAVCYYSTRGYTQTGNKIADEIAGFKMFLSTTEKERMKVIGTPPERTPELYEKYLPYAVALGVEEQWSKQFAPIFAKMAEQGHAYTPIWYSGRGFDGLAAGNFASDLSNTLNYSISSSSNVPGSESGSDGGGSSGGGGGGGGGGSW